MLAPIKKIVSVVALAVIGLSQTVAADPISMPHQFQAGQPASARQVNENFSTLQYESNAQDRRIGDLERSSSARLAELEQMICQGSYLVVGQDSEIVCQDETGVRNYSSLAAIYAEDWKMVSVGGTGDANRVVMLFHK